MSLDRSVYGMPNVIERLARGHRTTEEEYVNRATQHIKAFDRAFNGHQARTTEFYARF